VPHIPLALWGTPDRQWCPMCQQQLRKSGKKLPVVGSVRGRSYKPRRL
jgi:hypothetical protein